MKSDLAVNYRLVMNDGDINTNGNILRIGIDTTNYGIFDYTQGSIIGKLKKWVEPGSSSQYLPIGNENPDDTTIIHHRHVDLDFSANAPDSGGTLTLEFFQKHPGDDGLPLTDNDGFTVKNIATTGFWNIEAGDGMETDDYAYNIELTAADFIDVQDTTKLRTVKRPDSTSSWVFEGQHASSNSENGNPVIRRNGLTSFSDFTAAGDEDNPLPVEFTGANIRTSNSGEIATIEWHTATETENYRFYIDRSYLHDAGEGPAKDTSWSQIGFKEGQGTTSNSNSYRFEDTGLDKAGKYAYRIRQIDYDGTETLLTTLELVVGSPNRTGLGDNYPNPFNPATNVPYKLAEGGEVSINVYNTLGQQVATLVDKYQRAGQYEVRFDASSLTSGIYFIRLKANGYSVNKSITLIK